MGRGHMAITPDFFHRRRDCLRGKIGLLSREEVWVTVMSTLRNKDVCDGFETRLDFQSEAGTERVAGVSGKFHPEC